MNRSIEQYCERRLQDGGPDDDSEELAKILTRRGSALFDRGRASEALADLDRSILIRIEGRVDDDDQPSPSLAASLNLRGLILAKLHRVPQALRNYQRAV